jgi:sulfate adenylyltransferase subunit 1 (EFTu-like GTPase family)
MPSQGVKLRLMDGVTEVRYGSVIVGRSPQIRDRNNAGAFVVFIEPLPVGTPIALKIDDKEMYARVTEVVESADEAVAGMRVRFVDSVEWFVPVLKSMVCVVFP